MITQMTKYSIILMSGEMDGFLSDLQNLGLVDVTRKQKPFDKASGEKFVQIEQNMAVHSQTENSDSGS